MIIWEDEIPGLLEAIREEHEDRQGECDEVRLAPLGVCSECRRVVTDSSQCGCAR
jgi:hypothetical protein